MDMNEGFDAYLKELENSGSGIAPSQNSFGLDDLFGSDTKLPSNTATLTVKVDVDCNLYIDGDLVDDAIQANQIKKVPVPLGEHIITIESHYHSAITEDREIDIKEAGKNQVLLVKGLQERERELVLKQLNKQKELVRAEREKEEDRLKKERIAKEEQENMRKGEEYYNSHIYDLAIQCVEKVLETSENSDAMLFIGKCYDRQNWENESIGVFRKAVSWYKKSAELDNAEAQYRLGGCYEEGVLERDHIIERDYKKAVFWYSKAAEQGYAKAIVRLGVCYEGGFCDIEEDHEKAVEWFRKAAEKGYGEAQYHLGNCYRDGKGVSKDIAKALEWYQKAAEEGYEYALDVLYDCYYYGRMGVKKDLTKAAELLSKGKEAGYVWTLFK